MDRKLFVIIYLSPRAMVYREKLDDFDVKSKHSAIYHCISDCDVVTVSYFVEFVSFTGIIFINPFAMLIDLSPLVEFAKKCGSP